MLQVVGFLVLSNLYKYINSNIFQHNIFSLLSSNFFIALSPESKGLTIAPSCAVTIVSSVFQIFYRIVPKVKRINDCPIMRDYNCIIEYFQNCPCIFLFFFFFSDDGKICETEHRASRLRQFDRIVECLAGSIYIYYIYMCIPNIVLYLLRSHARILPLPPRSPPPPLNILTSPFTLIMSLHLVTADARYSLSWGSLLLDEPVTRSLFVILILSSRDSVHSGVKRAFSTAILRSFSLPTILTLRRSVTIILQQTIQINQNLTSICSEFFY